MKCPKCQFENPTDSSFCAKCGTQIKPSKEKFFSSTETLKTPIKELATGTIFAGRYEVIEELGKGGMGKVYKIFDKKIKEKVALKLLKPEIASDEETIERFSNELRFARKIAHRNVCRMYDLGEEQGTHYITMEYVSGEDLKSTILRVGQLSVGKTVSTIKQVCEGLAEAHRLGVVHRDLKPQNIMIDKEGNAKIMDFGIARSLKAKGITGAGVMIGTPEYMSPEQVEGKEADQRADIYSLGIILYEMLTGHVPFEGDTPFSVAYKQKNEIPLDPKKFNPQIPDDLGRLVLRCMEKEREKRYQSADEVSSELSKIERGIPTTERIVPQKKPLTSKQITITFGMKKLLIPALGVIALAAVGVLIWRFLPKKQLAPPPSGKPSLAILYFENNSGDKNLEFWKTGLTGLLITKLAQSKYLNVLSDDRVYGILKKLNLLEARKYSTEDLTKVANEGQATHTLNGSLMKAGENIIINLTLQMPQTGRVISSIPVECKDEKEIMSKVDEVATKIKSDLNLSSEQISGDIDKETGKITTSSPEAYKYYVEARKHHLRYEHSEAIQLYEKAVAIDPGFAMAYRGMAAVYYNLGRRSKSTENLQKALNLSDRVSDRERYFIQGDFYTLTEKTYDIAIEALNKLLELYPDDANGYHYLGWIYRDLEEWDKAIESFVMANKIRKSVLDCSNLGSVYEAMGLYDKARQVYVDYLENVIDDPQIYLSLGWNYLFQGKFNVALAEADKAFLLDPSLIDTLYLKGDIYHLSVRFAEAEKEYLQLLEKEAKTQLFSPRWNLAAIYLSQGRFQKAREELKIIIDLADEFGEKTWKIYAAWYSGYLDMKQGLSPKALEEFERALKLCLELELLPAQRFIMAWQGLCHLETGAVDKAQKVAAELKELIEKGMNQKAMRYYYFLEGKIDLKKGNFSKAIENFNKAISLLSFQWTMSGEHAFYFDALATAYAKAGDLEKAGAAYDKITSLTGGRTLYGDIYAKSFYMLGKIAEQRGDKTRARENYKKFLDLWKNADKDQPDLIDAQKRLSSLL